MKLLQALFAKGIISESQMNDLAKEVEKTGRTEEALIMAKDIIPEKDLFEIKSKILGIPLLAVDPEEVAADVFDLIPEEANINYKIAALSKKENLVQIGMVYPEDIAAQNALRFLANQEKFDYHIYLITNSNLNDLLKQRKTMKAEVKRDLAELEQEQDEILLDLDKKSYDQVIAEDAPIIKMVLVMLRHALEANASDIHIEPGREKLKVRFRQNGILYPSLFLPLKVHPSIVARIKILSGLKIDESRVPQDGRFSTDINGSSIDFRVSTFPTLYGEKVEIRILDPASGAKSFEDLGLDGRNLEVVKNVIHKPFGMILFTGPTGSGKTTSQYAILRILNEEGVNIVTIEDPIEYSIEGINQSQVKPEIGYTFASGLRQILRQDPNIVMVGEIRDEETVDLVVNASLTGHIVLSTLHANSSVGVIPRMIDMGVRPFLIPSTLRVVISQRLIRTLCPNCKVKIRPNEKIERYILEKIKSLPVSAKNKITIENPLHLYQARGCESCSLTGYAGRVGLFEVLSMSNELAELILKNPLESAILKVAQKQGMVTMEQAGIIKVLAGQTTIEEVTRVTEET